MHTLLIPLLQLQRFFVPALLGLLLWSIWKTLFKKDQAVGLALYACLVVVVDGFYNTGLFIPGMSQGSIRYSEICALFLLANRPAAPKGLAFRGWILFFVGAYFCLMLIAALRAQPMMQGIFDFRRIMVPQILTFILACRGLPTRADYRRFLLCFTTLVMIVGLFSFWDVFFERWILHSDMLFKPEYAHNRHRGRYGSIFLNPNLLGAFVVLVSPPILAMVLKERHRWARPYLWVTLLALLFCLVETQSRAPLAAFAGTVALFILGPAAGLSRGRRLLVVGAAALIFTLFMPGFIEHAMGRFSTLDTERSEEDVSRASVWKYTEGIISEHPLMGIGFGEKQFLAEMENTDFKQRYGRQSLDNPHNSYLQATVYAGIPALILFLLANLALLKRAFSFLWRGGSTQDYATEVFGLSTGIVGFLVCLYPDMHLFTANLAPIYWLFFGILLSFLAQAELPAGSAATAAAGKFTRKPFSRRPRSVPSKS